MKEYLSVGEMSSLFNLNKQTLQYYDKEKIFCPEYRNPDNNYRRYRFDQVYGLALICYLRKIGFSIAQIKNYLCLHNSEAAIRELKKHSHLLQSQYQQVLSMDHVLQRKLNYVEHKMQTMVLEQAQLRSYPRRKYIPLGKESKLYTNEVFYFYPTIAFVSWDTEREKRTLSFGAYLAPDDTIPVKFVDNIGNIESQRFLCACFKGPYDDVIAFSDELRRRHPDLPLSRNSVHFNVIDQFIETNSQEYITEIQIPILD